MITKTVYEEKDIKITITREGASFCFGFYVRALDDVWSDHGSLKTAIGWLTFFEEEALQHRKIKKLLKYYRENRMAAYFTYFK